MSGTDICVSTSVTDCLALILSVVNTRKIPINLNKLVLFACNKILIRRQNDKVLKNQDIDIMI